MLSVEIASAITAYTSTEIWSLKISVRLFQNPKRQKWQIDKAYIF